VCDQCERKEARKKDKTRGVPRIGSKFQRYDFRATLPVEEEEGGKEVGGDMVGLE